MQYLILSKCFFVTDLENYSTFSKNSKSQNYCFNKNFKKKNFLQKKSYTFICYLLKHDNNNANVFNTVIENLAWRGRREIKARKTVRKREPHEAHEADKTFQYRAACSSLIIYFVYIFCDLFSSISISNVLIFKFYLQKKKIKKQSKKWIGH